MESARREQNQRKLKLGTRNESNRLQFLEEKKYFRISKIWENVLLIQRSGELWVIQETPERIRRLGPYVFINWGREFLIPAEGLDCFLQPNVLPKLSKINGSCPKTVEMIENGQF